MDKLNSFRDLKVWRKAADLSAIIYSCTGKFPASEIYGLANQMRRAVISISSNIAEGFKRAHRKEKTQFYYVACGSAAELESQTEIARKLDFLTETDYEKLLGLISEVSKMMEGLLKSLNSKSYILNSREEGFTLVELMVAVGIFVILTGIAVGGFARAIRTQRQVQALLAANSNASLAIEVMARSIRTGRYFCHDATVNPDTPDTTGDCLPSISSGSPYDKIAFVDSQGCKVAYSLSLGAIVKDVISGPLSCGSAFSGALTSDNVKITYLTFVLLGNDTADGYPPRITIAMGVAPNSLDPALSGSVINLQTTVSSRQPDN